jgi:hypothetical protein
MSGTPVFVGTRVPFQTMIDDLEGGQPRNHRRIHEDGRESVKQRMRRRIAVQRSAASS